MEPDTAPVVRAIGYVRVSTDEQAASGLGMESQRLLIEAEAVVRGWQLRIIEDVQSARDSERPGLQQALLLLEGGYADVLCVSKLDRLTRSLKDFSTLLIQAQKQGWEIIAMDLGVDTSTPIGEVMASVMVTFAQYERRLISQRTRSAMRVLRDRGVVLGRPKGISPEVERQICSWRYYDYHTLRRIQSDLHKAGILPPDHERTGNRKWATSTLSKILRRNKDRWYRG